MRNFDSLLQYFQGHGFFSFFFKKSVAFESMTTQTQAPPPILTQNQIEDIVHDTIEPKQSWFHRWFPYLKWSPTSPEELQKAEEELLSYVKTKSQGKYVEVNIDEKSGQKCRIWTRIFKNEEEARNKLPLVMIHGMGSGLALFAMNYDELAKSRTVYAIDLPGYARSSRCKFSSKPEEAEKQYVQALENWRQKCGLDKFCLLGHSFGGYLSSAYALNHPDHVSHLILADPWGMPEKPKEEQARRIPIWIKVLYHVLFKHLNPLAGLRMAGPWGLQSVTRFRPDLISKFGDLFDNEEENKRVIPNYIYHCNVHNPTGEAAFHSLMKGFAWAENPMLPRLKNLQPSVPLTALYGADSWITAIPEDQFKEIRGSEANYTKMRLIDDAGHHVYANPAQFDYRVLQACQYSDGKLQ